MAQSGTVIVVEDDAHISDLVEMYLRRENFRVLQTNNGKSALEIIDREKPKAVILDIGLEGDLDGLEVLKLIRAKTKVPVILLTARGDELDRILGLELGSDDYITKPFSPRELMARLKAVLRRFENNYTDQQDIIEILDLKIDAKSREVFVKNQQIELASKEFDLLYYLAKHKSQVLSRQQLLDGVWGVNWYGDPRTVDVHIRQLRKKIGDENFIKTVWGVGYRLG
jgi:DNA-binding response OmpR family regulator